MLSFGQRLKMLRNEADISQYDLAESLGVSAQSVSKWECDAYFPDVSMLLPLATVLGVTTDCLLGAGTNEKEDIEALKKEMDRINAEPWQSGHRNRNYKTFRAIEEFLKKYPLNYDYKLTCADFLYCYLLRGRKQKAFEIPDDEFEKLWAKGFKMANAVKNQDRNPTRLNYAREIIMSYYCIKGEYDKAESVAMELPILTTLKSNALLYIAEEKHDFESAEKLAQINAIRNYQECAWSMCTRAQKISVFGQVRKEEAIEAWRDAMKSAYEYDRLFGKYWPYKGYDDLSDCIDHPKTILSLIYFRLTGDFLALERIEDALNSVEELTELGIEYHAEIKEKLNSGEIDEKAYSELLASIKEYPLNCYNFVISDEDNILTREERYKACKARLDALE